MKVALLLILTLCIFASLTNAAVKYTPLKAGEEKNDEMIEVMCQSLDKRMEVLGIGLKGKVIDTLENIYKAEDQKAYKIVFPGKETLYQAEVQHFGLEKMPEILSLAKVKNLANQGSKTQQMFTGKSKTIPADYTVISNVDMINSTDNFYIYTSKQMAESKIYNYALEAIDALLPFFNINLSIKKSVYEVLFKKSPPSFEIYFKKFHFNDEEYQAEVFFPEANDNINNIKIELLKKEAEYNGRYVYLKKNTQVEDILANYKYMKPASWETNPSFLPAQKEIEEKMTSYLLNLDSFYFPDTVQHVFVHKDNSQSLAIFFGAISKDYLVKTTIDPEDSGSSIMQVFSVRYANIFEILRGGAVKYLKKETETTDKKDLKVDELSKQNEKDISEVPKDKFELVEVYALKYQRSYQVAFELLKRSTHLYGLQPYWPNSVVDVYRKTESSSWIYKIIFEYHHQYRFMTHIKVQPVGISFTAEIMSIEEEKDGKYEVLQILAFKSDLKDGGKYDKLNEEVKKGNLSYSSAIKALEQACVTNKITLNVMNSITEEYEDATVKLYMFVLEDLGVKYYAKVQVFPTATKKAPEVLKLLAKVGFVLKVYIGKAKEEKIDFSEFNYIFVSDSERQSFPHFKVAYHFLKQTLPAYQLGLMLQEKNYILEVNKQLSKDFINYYIFFGDQWIKYLAIVAVPLNPNSPNGANLIALGEQLENKQYRDITRKPMSTSLPNVDSYILLENDELDKKKSSYWDALKTLKEQASKFFVHFIDESNIREVRYRDNQGEEFMLVFYDPIFKYFYAAITHPKCKVSIGDMTLDIEASLLAVYTVDEVEKHFPVDYHTNIVKKHYIITSKVNTEDPVIAGYFMQDIEILSSQGSFKLCYKLLEKDLAKRLIMSSLEGKIIHVLSKESNGSDFYRFIFKNQPSKIPLYYSATYEIGSGIIESAFPKLIALVELDKDINDQFEFALDVISVGAISSSGFEQTFEEVLGSKLFNSCIEVLQKNLVTFDISNEVSSFRSLIVKVQHQQLSNGINFKIFFKNTQSSAPEFFAALVYTGPETKVNPQIVHIKKAENFNKVYYELEQIDRHGIPETEVFGEEIKLKTLEGDKLYQNALKALKHVLPQFGIPVEWQTLDIRHVSKTTYNANIYRITIRNSAFGLNKTYTALVDGGKLDSEGKVASHAKVLEFYEGNIVINPENEVKRVVIPKNPADYYEKASKESLEKNFLFIKSIDALLPKLISMNIQLNGDDFYAVYPHIVKIDIQNRVKNERNFRVSLEFNGKFYCALINSGPVHDQHGEAVVKELRELIINIPYIGMEIDVKPDDLKTNKTYLKAIAAIEDKLKLRKINYKGPLKVLSVKQAIMDGVKYFIKLSISESDGRENFYYARVNASEFSNNLSAPVVLSLEQEIIPKQIIEENYFD